MKLFLSAPVSRLQQIILLVTAGLVVLLLYSLALDCGFVLDDKNNIEINPYIHLTSLTEQSLRGAVSYGILPKRAVANISFALNHLIHGLDTTGFRLVNILLHIATGIILYFFIDAFLSLPSVRKKYGPPGMIPLVTAVLWLLHPAWPQTVNYIVQRMTILAALFYLLSIFLYIKGRTTRNSVHRWFYFSGVVLAGFLGLASKETVALLPIFIGLFEWYFIRDIQKIDLKRSMLLLAAPLLVFLGLALWYLNANPITFILNSYGSRDFTLGQRLLTESRVVLFYFSLLILPLPSRQNLEHDFIISTSLLSPLSTLFAIALICCALVFAMARTRKYPVASFCILWFFGNLALESSFIGLEIIFEHRLYLPSMLMIMLAVMWFRKLVEHKRLQASALVIILFCFALWNFERNRTWTDTVSLLTDSAEKSPNKPRPHLNLGIELKNRDRLHEAIARYNRALELKPDYAEAYYNMGNALLLMGDFKNATDNYFKALKLTPHDVDTHYNLGYSLSKIWRFDEAKYHYSEAIRLNPGFQEARKELAELNRYVNKLYGKKKHSR